MNTFRAFLFSSILVAVLVAVAAVQPATAQKAHPTQKHHQKIPPGKDCSTCHKATYAQWKTSPHGANDVQCTVCHGEITAESVAATPSLSACEGCHAEQVAQLKTDPFMKGKTCVSCHPPHTFMPHKVAVSKGK